MDINATVISIIQDTLRQPTLQVAAQMTARDVPGWDSFAMVSMILMIQEVFEIEFDTEDLDRIQSVGDLIQIIENKHRQKNTSAEICNRD